jgi:hypothetical protein
MRVGAQPYSPMHSRDVTMKLCEGRVLRRDGARLTGSAARREPAD